MRQHLFIQRYLFLTLLPLLRRGLGGGLLLLTNHCCIAQQPSGFSFLYTNFYYHDSVGYINPNGVQGIYADTERIFTNTNADDPNDVYVGAHDYEGNQLFRKKINYPKDKFFLIFSAYNQSNTLTKISDDVYLCAGFAYDWITLAQYNYSINRPFFYFFDSNGDSIRFLTPLTIGVKSLTLTAVYYDSMRQEIVATGFGSSDTGVSLYNPERDEYFYRHD